MKQAKTTMMVGIGFILGGIILALATNFDTTTLIIGIVAVLIGVGLFKGGKEKSRKFCQKCASSLNGCAYRWKETRRYVKNSSEYSVVRITSICPNCGHEFTFTKEFCYYNDNTRTYYDIESLVDSYTIEKFGH